ncbi:MAG: hypothetical protein IKW96_06575 [Ruminococcus sp.]|uniref:hypothetical protein n=1 Tax=Ruminococcus sp. TaxID=41978 RepID=UPI0025F79A30|nr:hypothetical protein [Ruminococcus sp.]MBR5682928.1 hypothetical protein [Ruminococcus sp.]
MAEIKSNGPLDGRDAYSEETCRLAALAAPYLEEKERVLFGGGCDEYSAFSAKSKKAFFTEIVQLFLSYCILASVLTYILYFLTYSALITMVGDMLLLGALVAGIAWYKSKAKNVFVVTDKNIISINRSSIVKVKLTDVVDVTCTNIAENVGTIYVLYPNRNFVGEFVAKSPFTTLDFLYVEDASVYCEMIRNAVSEARKNNS